MIDTNDKTTQALDLGAEPKRRGRPSTGNAMTNAERQKAYRERMKERDSQALESAEIEQLKRGFYIECLEPKCRKWKKWSQHEAMSLYAAEATIRSLELAEDAAKEAGLGGSRYRIMPA